MLTDTNRRPVADRCRAFCFIHTEHIEAKSMITKQTCQPSPAADAFDHLLSLARQGKSAGASTGEKQARKIVNCLLTNAIGLDARATAGITELAAIIQRYPQRGRDAVREAIQ